jgi:hypothetical protein
MSVNLQLVTPPSAEPVTLAQAHSQLTLDTGFTTDDTMILGLITAARQYAEKYTYRAFFNQQWVRTLDHFPYWYCANGTVNPANRADWPYYAEFWNRITIDVPKPATLSLDSITYIDQTGAVQTLPAASYQTDLISQPARIVPTSGNYWPTVLTYLPGSVKIAFTAGSYVQKYTDTLVVAEAAGVSTVTLSQATAFAAGTLLFTGGLSLVDATGNPVAFTDTDGVLTVAATYAGRTLTATYYGGNAPQTVQQAILLMVSHWYNSRDASDPLTLKEIPLGVHALLDCEKLEVQSYKPYDQ